MGRWVYKVLVIVSLLLAVFVSVMWVGLNWDTDSVGFVSSHHGAIGIYNCPDGVGLGYRTFRQDDARQFYHFVYSNEDAPYRSNPLPVIGGGGGLFGGGGGGGGFTFGGGGGNSGGLFGGSGSDVPVSVYEWINEMWPDNLHWGFGAIAADQMNPSLSTRDYRGYVLVVPPWALLILFLLLPTKAFVHRMGRYYRHYHYRCVDCGYDLRASRERCPECGRAIEETFFLPRKERIKPKWVGLAGVCILVCSVGWIFAEPYARTLWHQIAILKLQRQCMQYPLLAPDHVIWPNEAITLFKAAPECWIKYEPHVMAAPEGKGFSGDARGTYFIGDRPRAIATGEPVLMHEMLNGACEQRLVAVFFSLQSDGSAQLPVLWAKVIDPATILQHPAINYENCEDLITEDQLGFPLKIYAGQIDPTNAARFTVRVDENDKTIIFEGTIENDDTVRWNRLDGE